MTFIQRCKDDFQRKGIVLDIDHVLGTPNIHKRVFPRLVPIYCYDGYFYVFPAVVESLIFF